MSEWLNGTSEPMERASELMKRAYSIRLYYARLFSFCSKIRSNKLTEITILFK